MHIIVERLVDDHKKILKFINSFEKELIKFMKEDKFSIEDFQDDIVFIRTFADKEHHKREEHILFKYMMENLGEIAENLIRYGMYVEHDLGRFYISEFEKSILSYDKEENLEDKLKILSFGEAYCNLLRRHIEKEDKVVYLFAEKSLSEELFDKMLKEDDKYLNNK